MLFKMYIFTRQNKNILKKKQWQSWHNYEHPTPILVNCSRRMQMIKAPRFWPFILDEMFISDQCRYDILKPLLAVNNDTDYAH